MKPPSLSGQDGTHAVVTDSADNQSTLVVQARNYVWDAGQLKWVKETQPAGGGGGGGAVTVADGADVTQGAIADTAVVGDNTGTVSAKLRGINKALAGTLTVQFPSAQAVSQSGTWNVGLNAGTQVIGHVIVDSGTVTANQGGAPWSVSQSGTWNIGTITTLTGITNHVTVDQGAAGAAKWLVTADPITFASAQHVIVDSGTITANQGGAPWSVSQSGTWNVGTLTSITNPVAVTGTFWQTTQPVSAAALPLPSNASQEQGGNLDSIRASISAHQESALAALMQAFSQPMAGFVPMEIPTFLGGF